MQDSSWRGVLPSQAFEVTIMMKGATVGLTNQQRSYGRHVTQRFIVCHARTDRLYSAKRKQRECTL